MYNQLLLKTELKASCTIACHHRNPSYWNSCFAAEYDVRYVFVGAQTGHWHLGTFWHKNYRLGVYCITERRGLTKDSNGRTSLLKGAAAAGVGGALGSIAGTPFFLVKTRLQAQAARAIAVGHQHQHTGTLGALADIYKREGVKGNIRSVLENCLRESKNNNYFELTFAGLIFT